jgi:hypothetical protein
MSRLRRRTTAMSIAGGLIVPPNSAAHEMGDPRARYLILAWHAGDVGTGTPDPSALHDGSPPSGLRHMPSHEFAAGSTAKDEDFKPFLLRHGFLPV